MNLPPYKDSVRPWLTSIALAGPAAWPYVTHYVRGAGHLAGTGFIQYDMPSYMAEAREYFDHGGLTYGNPYSPFFDTPAVYFQPQTLFLGTLWKLTGVSPGVIFMCFGAIAAICCMRVAVSVYREVAPFDTASARLGLLAFAWGGGVLALTGIAANTLGGSGSIFRFDPYHGWWILNFGRNLIYPTEAFYHALFFCVMLFLIRKRFTAALALTLLLSISHPFSGVELLLILCTWSLIERYFLENDQVPWSFFAACCGILLLHLGYYLAFLNRFPEHRLIAEQWKIPALLQAENFIPADLLVGGLAAWSARRLPLARSFFAVPHNRLFLVWFLVAFALANHEFAIRPVQPLHFDRGYIWTPLFLMGVPALLGLFDFLRTRWTRSAAAMALALTMALLLSDNILWLGAFTFRQEQGIRLTSDEQSLLGWLNAGENRGFIILSRTPRISYLAMTYTPLRSWFSHNNNTPEYQLRSGEAEAYFHDGVFLDRWKTMPLLIVHDSAAPSSALSAPHSNPAMNEVFRNGTFTVIRHEPRPPG
jgi:hypothetical protein